MVSRERIHRLELAQVSLFGRTKELDVLETAFSRTLKNGTSEFVTIAGYSGTGKSRLVDAFLSKCVRDNAYYCSGKCDVTRSYEPFSVVKDALQELCCMLMEQETDVLKDIIRDIKEEIGSEGAVLTNVIPRLADLIGHSPLPAHNLLSHDAASANDQLNYLFRCLLRSITKHVPLVMFCDDLQWVDASSLAVLSWLGVDPKMTRFLLIGSYRINEVGENHHLTRELENISKRKGAEVIQILLQNLTATEVNALIAQILKLQPEETIGLSDVVYEKTHGNVFFVLQFLQVLENEQLLTFSFAKVRWLWVDTQRIRNDTNIADNVVDLIANKIKRLHPDVQSCLTVASCLSSTVSVVVLRAIMAGLYNADTLSCHLVETILEEAKDEGFLLPLDQRLTYCQYKFAHDRIQQAAYSLIPDGPRREQLHHYIGLELLKIRNSLEIDERQHEWIGFVVPDQLQRGLSCIRGDKELVHLAALNLAAGQKAMSLAAFEPAAQYLRNGIDIMTNVRRGWKLHHDLQLALHQSLAEVSWSIGSPAESEKLVHSVVKHARTWEERIPAFLTLAQLLGAQEKHKEAVDVEVRELTALNVFPKNFRTVKALRWLTKLRKKLTEISIREVLSLRACTNPRIVAAMEFLRMLGKHSTYHGDEILQLLSAVVSVNLMLKYGYHRTSVSAFAQTGAMITLIFGDAQEGYRLGTMTNQLYDKMRIKDCLGSLMVWSFLNPWCVPLNETLEPLLESYKTGMKQGDVEPAFVCFTTYLVHGFIAGLCLGPLLEDAKSHYETSIEYGVNATITPLRCIRQALLNMAGKCRNPLVLTGEAMNEHDYLASPLSNMALFTFYLYKMQVCFLYGRLKLAHEMMLQARKRSRTCVAFCDRSLLMYYEALIPLTIASKTGLSYYKRLARSAINTMRRSVTKEHKGMNQYHKLLLLDAGYLALTSSKPREKFVQRAFEKAIKMATRTGFRQDAALANLHAGIYFLNIRKDKNWAGYYIARSVELFEDWGAIGVALHLFRKYARKVDLSMVSRLSSTNHRGRPRHVSKVLTSNPSETQLRIVTPTGLEKPLMDVSTPATLIDMPPLS